MGGLQKGYEITRCIYRGWMYVCVCVYACMCRYTSSYYPISKGELLFLLVAFFLILGRMCVCEGA